jgi:hypothetical protein
VFTDDGPDDGRAVRIETNDPRVPVLEGKYAGGALHLKRPGDVRQPFDDLVVQYGLDNKQLRDLAVQAAALPADGALTIRLERSHGASIAKSLDRRDVKAALAELKHVQIEHDPAVLGVQQVCVYTRAARKAGLRLFVERLVGQPIVEESQAILAGYLDDCPLGHIDQPARLANRAVLGLRFSKCAHDLDRTVWLELRFCLAVQV